VSGAAPGAVGRGADEDVIAGDGWCGTEGRVALLSLCMALLDLTPDELLSTTRAVRRRLDLSRPVAHDLLEECVRLAVQAPTSTNNQDWSFVVVTDAAPRAALADCYRRASMADAARSPDDVPPDYLNAILHEIPAHVIPCIAGRPEGQTPPVLAAFYGSIIQAGWSFQLAARARGLGSVWTTYHLDYEREAADVLGIPFDEVTQVALIPVAHTIGTSFRPARRNPLTSVLHWQKW
jgi:nitroreductase